MFSYVLLSKEVNFLIFHDIFVMALAAKEQRMFLLMVLEGGMNKSPIRKETISGCQGYRDVLQDCSLL
jgi:hypothetical protein